MLWATVWKLLPCTQNVQDGCLGLGGRPNMSSFTSRAVIRHLVLTRMTWKRLISSPLPPFMLSSSGVPSLETQQPGTPHNKPSEEWKSLMSHWRQRYYLVAPDVEFHKGVVL